MPKLSALISVEVRASLRGIPSHTDPKAPPRVFIREGMGKVPPEPKNAQAWRAPRMGNAPVFRSGNMHNVYQEIVRYGLRSRAVASRSFETTNYPT